MQTFALASSRARRLLALLTVMAAAAALLLAAPDARADPPTGNLFARIAADGTLVTGAGAVSSSGGFGTYEVRFDQDVSTCAYLATPDSVPGKPLLVFTAGGHQSVDDVYVETKNQGGGLSPSPFDLVVDCGGADTGYAVVGYDNNLVRSSGDVSLGVLGPGRYQVTFPFDVSQCTSIATVGDPGNGLVYGPGGAYTGAGSTDFKIHVQTRDQGGTATRKPFHLAVYCPGASGVSGAIVRASGTSSHTVGAATTSSMSPGNYLLTTGTARAACAVLATRGLASPPPPFEPDTVAVADGPTADSAMVQVRTLETAGYHPVKRSFDVADVC